MTTPDTRTVPEDLAFLPPHEPTPVSGLHAYSHCLSLHPGQTMDLRIAGNGPVQVDIVRYGYNRDDHKLVEALGSVVASPQCVYRGDYLFIAQPPQLRSPLTIELWCRPLALRQPSALLWHADIQLLLDDAGVVGLHLQTADGYQTLKGPALSPETWHYIVATVDETHVRLSVDGIPGSELRLTAEFTATNDGPLLIAAARNADDQASAFYTGDLFAPAVYGRALAAPEIAARFEARDSQPARNGLAHWAFDGIGGLPYRDTTGHGHDARPVNYPTRMFPGPRISSNGDWHTYDPANDPDFGYAARFSRDTLVDCRWPISISWRAPDTLSSGHYGARITGDDGTVRFVDVVVSPSRPTNRLMCVSTTNTRLAYNFESFGDPDLDQGAYKTHGVYPLLATMNPVRLPAGGHWYQHTINFELPFYAWLDQENIPYDLYTEWDLEDRDDLTTNVAAIAVAGHSEYWTAGFYQRLRDFVDHGGHLLLMTGNTGFWRVSRDTTNQVIEIRKHEVDRDVMAADKGPMVAAAYCHQHDGQPGSYLHWCGYPVYNLTGGFSAGFTEPPIDGPRAGYRILDHEHELFRTPNRVDTNGEFAPDAAGYETDQSMRSALARFGDPSRPAYPHRDGTPAPRMAHPFDQDLVVLARAEIPGENYIFGYDADLQRGPMGAEMLWRTFPSGGHVFHAGSVLAAWVLKDHDNFRRFMLNVLHRMTIGNDKPARAHNAAET